MLIAIIDDNDEMRSFILLTLQIEFPHAVLMAFAYPRDFIFHNMTNVDLVVCDFCFGHTTIEFYLEKLSKYRLVVFSGSTREIGFDCYRSLEKSQFDELIELIKGLRSA